MISFGSLLPSFKQSCGLPLSFVVAVGMFLGELGPLLDTGLSLSELYLTYSGLLSLEAARGTQLPADSLSLQADAGARLPVAHQAKSLNELLLHSRMTLKIQIRPQQI